MKTATAVLVHRSKQTRITSQEQRSSRDTTSFTAELHLLATMMHIYALINY